MARYRKVEVRTWNDQKFRDLSAIPPCGQGLWLWFLTGPRTTNIPGVIVGSDTVMAAELKWPVEAFREAFGEAFAKGMAKGCWEAGLVWLPNACKVGDTRNKPESPNVIRSWRDTWDEIPECALKLEVWQHLKAFAEAFGEAFAKAFQEACRKPSLKPLPNQEQEQNQNQKQEQEQNTHSERAREDAKVLSQSDWLERLSRLWAIYPPGSPESERLLAEREIGRAVDEGHSWDVIEAGTQRYRLQWESRGSDPSFTMGSLKFYRERKFLDTWPVRRSKADRRQDDLVSAGQEFLRDNGGSA